ncbi:TPA: hypothetical protein N0F65_011065 [Lagenidium giganteum]|uniref:Uncharacterized protein n=1 Tax=Lagenidium giganteum TaxID=4803 RepID=A0AAV2ZHA1_9STRA|nr:TPA: hypothetical protein N0F65_011065 [Lagenidium giganteum]
MKTRTRRLRVKTPRTQTKSEKITISTGLWVIRLSVGKLSNLFSTSSFTSLNQVMFLTLNSSDSLGRSAGRLVICNDYRHCSAFHLHFHNKL